MTHYRPCPFCGSAAHELLHANTVHGRLFFVHCYGCGALGPDDADPTRAAELWNRRSRPLAVEGPPPPDEEDNP